MESKKPLNIEEMKDFKLVDNTYIIKNHRLGKGNFAETYLAVMKEDPTKLLACKMITKSSIKDRVKNSKNPEKRKEYIIN